MGRLLTIAVAAILAAEAQPAAFEIASIRAFRDEGLGPRNYRTTYGAQGIEMRARTLQFLIGEAYGFPVGRIVPGAQAKDALLQVLRQGYDITARSEAPASRDQLRIMLQRLLGERCQLALHRESRTELVYQLVQAKGGAKLEPADGGELSMGSAPEGYAFRNAEVHRTRQRRPLLPRYYGPSDCAWWEHGPVEYLVIDRVERPSEN